MNLDQLPYDNLIDILSNADLPSLRQYCLTSRKARQMCTDEQFWRQKYLSNYGNPKKLNNLSWQQAFIARYKLSHPTRIYTFRPVGSKTLYDPTEFAISILGRTEEEAISKLIDIYNNEITESPLYDFILNNYIESVIERENIDVDPLELDVSEKNRLVRKHYPTLDLETLGSQLSDDWEIISSDLFL